MQEQMGTAMQNAVNAMTQGREAGPAAAGAVTGRRTLAAMVSARETGCSCQACDLLRQEFETMIGAFLKSALEATGEAGAAAAAVAPEASGAELLSG